MILVTSGFVGIVDYLKRNIGIGELKLLIDVRCLPKDYIVVQLLKAALIVMMELYVIWIGVYFGVDCLLSCLGGGALLACWTQ